MTDMRLTDLSPWCKCVCTNGIHTFDEGNLTFKMDRVCYGRRPTDIVISRVAVFLGDSLGVINLNYWGRLL